MSRVEENELLKLQAVPLRVDSYHAWSVDIETILRRKGLWRSVQGSKVSEQEKSEQEKQRDVKFTTDG